MRRTLYTKIRRLSLHWHRDLGYFFSGLIIIYCISGIALNHVNDWDPDFILIKKEIILPQTRVAAKLEQAEIEAISRLTGEKSFKLYDFPTPGQVKIYYNNATFHVYLKEKRGFYERISKRPVFYQLNVLHRNSVHVWKWVSDIFAVMLILITITGMVIIKGKYGFSKRGIWLLLAGLIPPLAAVILQAIL
ncbi:PepSY-associated TM helix domain-containing protein [Haoranjiania flava]|uniref:PepSY-associated TM helix domain-containing protein n=1 Tax=Haoranjiania flava TaxID=1856322 RepID=A0AAE3IMK1_9BACT|nr:PepSY-associated TM helix domain-containing protein [Haoranjiania flava]MCU7694369.1 PepSY-associated TM helix domain-containing protein [Haoranjiania flava]